MHLLCAAQWLESEIVSGGSKNFEPIGGGRPHRPSPPLNPPMRLVTERRRVQISPTAPGKPLTHVTRVPVTGMLYGREGNCRSGIVQATRNRLWYLSNYGLKGLREDLLQTYMYNRIITNALRFRLSVQIGSPPPK